MASTDAVAVDRFLQICAAEIARRVAIVDKNHEQLASGAMAFLTAISAGSPLSGDLTTVPVIASLADIEPMSDVAEAALHAATVIPWMASPRMADAGTEAALAPLNEVYDFGAATCGLILLRPHGSYPLHAHPPQELYLPIADGGRWRYGGSDNHRTLGPDDLVYNNPNDLHAITAGNSPLLALYFLWTWESAG